MLLCCLAVQTGFAQRVGNSPYSQIGIGELVYPGFAPNVAIGSVGAAYANGIFINNVNPALLVRNRSTAFDVGFAGGLKQLRTGQAQQRDFNLNLNYLALAFPASRRWTLGVNLAPYSAHQYESTTRGTVIGSTTPALYTYRGLGGLNAVSFTNGVTVFRKEDGQERLIQDLAIGLQTSFVFGSITKEAVSQVFADSLIGYNVASVRRTNQSDLVFKPGVVYRHRLNDRVYWNVGATYDISRDLKGKQFSSIQYRGQSDGEYIELVPLDTVSATTRLPGGYQLGVSLEEPLHWALAADVTFRRFSDLQADNQLGALRNTFTLGVGGEWTPDWRSIDSYFKRATYRFGLNYSQMPFSVPGGGKQLSDVSLRGGVFLPITPADRRSVSYMNLSLAIGQRGTLESNLIRERYINVVFGFTINDFGWFLKPKID